MKKIVNVVARAMLHGIWIFVLWFWVTCFTLLSGALLSVPNATLNTVLVGELLAAAILWALFVIKTATD